MKIARANAAKRSHDGRQRGGLAAPDVFLRRAVLCTSRVCWVSSFGL